MTASTSPSAPRVFISYAHDSVPHREAVRDLWIFLRTNGIDARIDRTAAEERVDWTLWMQGEIAAADRILIVASPEYKKRASPQADPDDGRGVQFEARLIRDLFYRNQADLDRFLPVVLPGGDEDDVPDFLTPGTTTVYQVRAFTVAAAEDLLRTLLRRPSEVAPPVGPAPELPVRQHAGSLADPAMRSDHAGGPVGAAPALHHSVAVVIAMADSGVTTAVFLGGEQLGEPHTGWLPAGLDRSWDNLDTAIDRLAGLGVGLFAAMFDEQVGARLLALIDDSALGTVVDLVFHLPEPLSWLPVELLRVPRDRRLLATVAGVQVTRRLVGIDRVPTVGLAGPLKILAAVAAPETTETGAGAVDVEAEMQGLLEAVTDTALADAAQVRILEVASLAEITEALRADQYHVLHLFGHGSPDGIELEDEDGNAVFTTTEQLVGALRAGGHVLPLVVLASCSGAAGGTSGLAAALVARGADRVIGMHTTVSDVYATALGHRFYSALAARPDTTVAAAFAVARHDLEQQHAAARAEGESVRWEAAIPTLLAAGPDRPLRDPQVPPSPLRRAARPPIGVGVRELPLGALIGRRAPLRTAIAVVRGTERDRDRVGAWAGAVLTGVGGIGKTAVAGRAVARMRDDGWWIAEHVGAWNPTALSAAVADALVGVPQYQSLVDALRDLRVDDRAKLNAVLQLLARERILVLFDDFEQNLDSDTQRFLDPGFAEIFAAFVGAAGVGRLLVTCRYPIPDADLLLPIELPPLSPAELRRLFLRLPALRELPVEDRKLVVRTIGGHPRLIEFVDVLLRATGAGNFLHVTEKLRALARKEKLDLTVPRTVGESLDRAVLLGSRDIILDTLLAQLTPTQFDLVRQTGLLTASFSPTDLLHPTPDQLDGLADVQRLRELTLLSPAPSRGELVVHPWIGTALRSRLSDSELAERHRRAADMRLQRINAGRGGIDDIAEFIAHLAGCGDYDTAAAAALKAEKLVGGEVAVSALLAEVVPLIPATHANYLALADRECQALTAIGLVSATIDRRHALLAIAEKRAAADPGNVAYQHDLSVSQDRLGDLAVAIGDTRSADEHFHASLVIRERFAAADPGNAGYQRDLSLSHNRIGDLTVAIGDTRSAEQHYRAALVIAERLAAADPSNAGYQRDLSVSQERLGDLAVAGGDSRSADAHYRATLAIAERLAAADPGNALHQRDLSVSHNKLGELAVALGDAHSADAHYRAALVIRERLAAADPDNARYQRDVSVSHNKLGDLAVAVGDSYSADEHFRADLAIAERLATADPNNAEYQRDLSISHNKLGDLALAVGDSRSADEHLRAALVIAERLATADPNNAGYQRDLSISHNKLGDLALAIRNTRSAEQQYRAALAIREQLVATNPDNAGFQRDLDHVRRKLAELPEPG